MRSGLHHVGGGLLARLGGLESSNAGGAAAGDQHVDVIGAWKCERVTPGRRCWRRGCIWALACVVRNWDGKGEYSLDNRVICRFSKSRFSTDAHMPICNTPLQEISQQQRGQAPACALMPGIPARTHPPLARHSPQGLHAEGTITCIPHCSPS